MSRAAFAQKTHEQNVDYFKNWLCDTAPITVYEGLDEILSPNNSFYSLKEIQLIHIEGKLITEITTGDDFAIREGIIAFESLYNPSISDASIQSRPQFVKLIYQYISCFPTALYDAYKEITGEALRLDDLSEIREFYEHISQVDLCSPQEFCACISHCDPHTLDALAKYPEIDFLSRDPEIQELIVKEEAYDLSENFSCLLLRPDLYERNLPFVKAAVLGGAIELVHLDRDNWEKSSFNPKKGLEWAKKKGIEYHPVLDELLLGIAPAPAIVVPAIPESLSLSDLLSGYTTPYLEIIIEGIRELGITKENQGKKEAMTAWYLQRLIDRGLPPSRRLAGAMATISRLIESQQGRAKR